MDTHMRPKSIQKTPNAHNIDHLAALLQQIQGIGARQATNLSAQMLHVAARMSDVTTIMDYLRDTPAIWAQLREETQIEVTHRPLRAIPRIVSDVVAKAITKASKFTEICGGYKRGKLISHDIDILMVCTAGTGPEKLKQLTAITNSACIGSPHIRIRQPFQLGNDEASVLIDVYGSSETYVTIKADILFTTRAEYVFADLYLTGSSTFNVYMRGMAKKYGYKLNQHGLYTVDGQQVAGIKTDKDVFKLLHMKYKDASMRS
jgi:DNA polymerase/3'-5' exonuclease PolX